MNKKYYVYEWYNLNTDYVFYVGKGREKRVYEVDGRRNKRFMEYYNNNDVAVRIVFSSENEEECYTMEENIINELKSKNQACCNISPTSVGRKNNCWYKHLSVEEKIIVNKANSDSKKGKANGMFGKTGENVLNGRKYYAYDKDWNLVKEFKSLNLAKDFINVKHHSTLLLNLRKGRMYKGYYWKREDR